MNKKKRETRQRNQIKSNSKLLFYIYFDKLKKDDCILHRTAVAECLEQEDQS
jgi:hypothetical protein